MTKGNLNKMLIENYDQIIAAVILAVDAAENTKYVEGCDFIQSFGEISINSNLFQFQIVLADKKNWINPEGTTIRKDTVVGKGSYE